MDLHRKVHCPSPGILSAFIALLAQSCVAENFDDITVQADAMYSGNTFHGYAEMRVSLENHSLSRPHEVTLVYPNNAWDNYGNTIGRLSRTVTLAPNTRAVVPLLQPPLPVNGDRAIRVEVDRRHEGEIRAPNGNNHCSYNSGGNSTATAFISRSLDFDAVGRVLNAGHSPFSAAMATGPPDGEMLSMLGASPAIALSSACTSTGLSHGAPFLIRVERRLPALSSRRGTSSPSSSI